MYICDYEEAADFREVRRPLLVPAASELIPAELPGGRARTMSDSFSCEHMLINLYKILYNMRYMSNLYKILYIYIYCVCFFLNPTFINK